MWQSSRELLLGVSGIIAATYSWLRPKAGVDIESVLACDLPLHVMSVDWRANKSVRRSLVGMDTGNRTLRKQLIVKILVMAR